VNRQRITILRDAFTDQEERSEGFCCHTEEYTRL
jgi:hypothetical protein